MLAYYFMNAPMTAKASTLVSTTCAIGMMINMLQSLGIVGTMTVEWPVNINGIFQFLQACTSGPSTVIAGRGIGQMGKDHILDLDHHDCTILHLKINTWLLTISVE